ncbi:N-acetylmuramic acid 6-phosphate etherase [Arthrobacter sp. AL08]|uniref:N-acetylmuramic acid 6-phosphate etherase n=1 Tax=unclassified Arthrobacter TaxID=235627 RepID=UPI001CFFE0E2|nr:MULTISPECIES: N-acetylmuramic acid 6-phosphate etherase [unclassified Arthrobacter]MCB5282935.1 N-acetylmuramic acid 6-phosphate etherase [Arthrobacter sp. ES1]MDI3242111.1 N-acetylmuramic acid 6-phosphate etherase [Arthrobacter sp. AL05]MDI3277949.1 N-acetylmuramic acid 6-phosphate etherase [Arthrobacter sp. AL08]WGZ79439.1 N-acetylmuramic acid 6-phosphate etherase [Arthrobacter sp. EM1]
MAKPQRQDHPDHADLRDSLATLATEQVSERHPDLDLLSVAELVRAMNEEDAAVAAAVAGASSAITAAVEGIVDRMSAGGRLIYIGAGTAGRMGILDASEAPPTFGTDPGRVLGVIAGGPGAIHAAVENAEDDDLAGAVDLRSVGVSAQDAVIGISASGRTPYVLGAIEYASSVGAFTAGLACNPESELGRAADVAIDVVVGPEILTGSTRLKAGTAQKMVLNMLSTITMVRLGKTYRNLMVDMQATNEKLRARAERTVMLATQANAVEAARALNAVDGSVKAAILVLLTDLDAGTALRLLTAHRGFLNEAIGAALTDGGAVHGR